MRHNIAYLMTGMFLGMFAVALVAHWQATEDEVAEQIKMVELDPAPSRIPEFIQAVQHQTQEVRETLAQAREQHHCMALNVYREAGNQSWEGKAAVAQVVLNRVESRRWPNTPCEVIYDRRPGWQFSWVASKRLHTVRLTEPGSIAAWEDSVKVATLALTGELEDIVGHADHYHATYVNPRWNWSELEFVGQVGAHKFFAYSRRM